MGRAPCCDKNGLKKGPWTPEEDHKLTTFIQIHGPGNWRSLPKNAGLERCGKSCRLRWTNYLRPDIKRGRFSFEEEETIIQLHSILGNKWSAIAARLPGRTDNEIKNYWNTHIRKRLLRMGIDPVTHTPRIDLLDLSSILSTAIRNQSLLNLSTVLGNQAAAATTAMNPNLLRLISTLLTPKQEDQSTNYLLQNLQENQTFVNAQQNHQFQIQTPTQEQISMDHMISQLIQGNNNNVIETSNIPMMNFSSQNSQENMNILPSNLSDDHVFVNEMGSDLQEISNIENMGFDYCVKSSTTPLNSSSTYNINNSSSSNEDEAEKDSFCSNFFKFEIPEGLDFADFL